MALGLVAGALGSTVHPPLLASWGFQPLPDRVLPGQPVAGRAVAFSIRYGAWLPSPWSQAVHPCVTCYGRLCAQPCAERGSALVNEAVVVSALMALWVKGRERRRWT